MKRCKLYKHAVHKVGSICEHDWDRSPITKIIEVEDEVDIWETPIMIDGEFYSVCCSEGNCYKLRKMKYYKIDEEDYTETDYEEEITCPVCGYRQSDSWEYEDDNNDHICSACGSEYESYKHVEVSYSSVATNVNKNYIDTE